MTKRILTTIVLVIVALAACGKSRDSARAELAQMNIAYTETAFIKSAREGNAAAVALFIDGGMSPDTKTTAGQSALEAAVLANQVEAVKVLLEKALMLTRRIRLTGRL